MFSVNVTIRLYELQWFTIPLFIETKNLTSIKKKLAVATLRGVSMLRIPEVRLIYTNNRCVSNCHSNPILVQMMKNNLQRN